MDGVKTGLSSLKDAIWFVLASLSPHNIKEKYRMLRRMTYKELTVGFIKLNFNIAFMLLTFLFNVIWWVHSLCHLVSAHVVSSCQCTHCVVLLVHSLCRLVSALLVSSCLCSRCVVLPVYSLCRLVSAGIVSSCLCSRCVVLFVHSLCRLVSALIESSGLVSALIVLSC